MEELKRYINKAKLKLSKQKAHYCENWGQAELRKARTLFDYSHYQESADIIQDFERWIDEQ